MDIEGNVRILLIRADLGPEPGPDPYNRSERLNRTRTRKRVKSQFYMDPKFIFVIEIL